MGNFVNTSRFALKTIYNHEIDFKTTTDGTDCTEVWVFVNNFDPNIRSFCHFVSVGRFGTPFA